MSTRSVRDDSTKAGFINARFQKTTGSIVQRSTQLNASTDPLRAAVGGACWVSFRSLEFADFSAGGFSLGLIPSIDLPRLRQFWRPFYLYSFRSITLQRKCTKGRLLTRVSDCPNGEHPPCLEEVLWHTLI